MIILSSTQTQENEVDIKLLEKRRNADIQSLKNKLKLEGFSASKNTSKGAMYVLETKTRTAALEKQISLLSKLKAKTEWEARSAKTIKGSAGKPDTTILEYETWPLLGSLTFSISFIIEGSVITAILKKL